MSRFSDGLENCTNMCLCILSKMAKFRAHKTKYINDVEYICLGDENLVHNFIALVFMSESKYLFHNYFENSWAIFVPSIQYALDLIMDKEIVRKEIHQIYFKKLESLEMDSHNQLKKCELKKVDTLIKNLYPLDDIDDESRSSEKIDKIKANVRIASCLLSYGKKQMKKSELKKCYENVSMNMWDWNDKIIRTLNKPDSLVLFKENKFEFVGFK